MIICSRLLSSGTRVWGSPVSCPNTSTANSSPSSIRPSESSLARSMRRSGKQPSSFKYGTRLEARVSRASRGHITEGSFISTIGAFLVYDITSRDSFNNISKWLSDLKSNSSENVIIYLIGNKNDEKEKLVKQATSSIQRGATVRRQ